METPIKPKIQLNALVKPKMSAKAVIKPANVPPPIQKIQATATIVSTTVTKQQTTAPEIKLDSSYPLECPIQKASALVEGKWTLLIIRELLGGKKRYSELQKAIDGISPKLLSTRLTMLRTNKLVSKKIYPTIPPKTEYTLTSLGQELEIVINALATFGSKL